MDNVCQFTGCKTQSSLAAVHCFAVSIAAMAAVVFIYLPGGTRESFEAAELPAWAHTVLHCLARCSALGSAAQKHLSEQAEEDYARMKFSPWRLPEAVCNKTKRRCDVLHDSFCAGLQCHAGVELEEQLPRIAATWQDLARLDDPLQAVQGPPTEDSESFARAHAFLDRHLQCAARCASREYLTVRVNKELSQRSVTLASSRLAECGLVHLYGDQPLDGAEEGFSDEWRAKWKKAVEALRIADVSIQSELSKVGLRNNRTEWFIPFEGDSLPNPLAQGVITSVIQGYIQEPFSLDYVSVLNAQAGIAGAQELHGDVFYFPRTSISVHVAMEDIRLQMGPTLFCPCTHSMTGWDGMPTTEDIADAVRFAAAFRGAIRVTDNSSAPRQFRCVGKAYVPEEIAAGLVTIYDGSVIHAGLANTGRTDRIVLNMNFASPPGYEEKRDYTGRDTQRVIDETQRWRNHFNTAMPAEHRFENYYRWFSQLPIG